VAQQTYKDRIDLLALLASRILSIFQPSFSLFQNSPPRYQQNNIFNKKVDGNENGDGSGGGVRGEKDIIKLPIQIKDTKDLNMKEKRKNNENESKKTHKHHKNRRSKDSKEMGEKEKDIKKRSSSSKKSRKKTKSNKKKQGSEGTDEKSPGKQNEEMKLSKAIEEDNLVQVLTPEARRIVDAALNRAEPGVILRLFSKGKEPLLMYASKKPSMGLSVWSFPVMDFSRAFGQLHQPSPLGQMV
jgi:hypothetical protein